MSQYMSLKTGASKEGWCNACTDRPPYEPDITYQLRLKSTVTTFCPKCARQVPALFTKLIKQEPQ